MKKYALTFGLFFVGYFAYSQIVLSGKVINSKTKESLPFVNISVRNTTRGATSDVEGKFRITLSGTGEVLDFSFVGFESYSLRTDSGLVSPVVISLREKTTQLTEITVRSGENPALKIIRKVVENKRFNDPENLPTFSYHAYNKLYLTMSGSLRDTSKIKKTRDSTQSVEVDSASASDSVQKKKPSKSVRPKKKMSKADSARYKKFLAVKSFMKNNHLFISESYTERKYVKPKLSKETVLGNQMSGIKDPFFAFMATDFQPFSFYKDFIPLFDVKYLNPLSPEGPSKYDFEITDTLYHGVDSVYLISFQPLPGKSFQGLKGQLYINTDGYAVEHVLAETADPKVLIEFHIQQKYAKQDGHWFPIQLNSELRFKEYKVIGMKPRYIARSYLTDVKIGESISKREFGLLNVEFDPMANHKKENFWALHRPDSLDTKEKATYKFYSKNSGMTRMMNNNMKIVEGLIVGRFRVGPFYVPWDNLWRYDKYEGVRIGVGAETGERISQRFILSGYAAYGFRDKAVKYGGGLQLNLLKNRDGFLKASYNQDVSEPGGSNFIKNPIGAINNESLRNYFVFRMDSVRQYKVELGIRPIRFSQASLFLQQQQRNPAYTYSYITEKDALGQQRNFIATEIGLQWRFAWKENYTQIGNSKVITNLAYPMFNLAASRGLTGLWKGEYSFTKIEAKLDEQWTLGTFGTTTIQLNAGKVTGAVPYPFLFNGKGAQYNHSFLNSFVVNNYFQTMGFYEFVNDQFAYLFINHNFGRITGTKSAYFRPELSVVHNMGIGSLQNKEAHQGIIIKTMDKGYLESGLVINNLVRFKNANLFYLGFGAGAFYRYGYYSLPQTSNNFAFKFMVTASF